MLALYCWCFFSLVMGTAQAVHVYYAKDILIAIGATLFLINFCVLLARIIHYHMTPVAKPSNLNTNPILVIQGTPVEP
jgi:hypothetical protein